MATKKNDNAYAPCRHMSDLASCMQAPSHAVPTVEYTVRNFNLPFTADDISWLRSAEINPFAADQRPTTGRSAISSSRNLSPSTLSFDQPFVLMGLCVYAYADPMSFTLPLNAFGPRAEMTGVSPASPDQLFAGSANFNNTIFGGAGNVPAGLTLNQAVLEWGGPAWRAIWAFLHAFRLEMRAPNNNFEILMDESLADIGNCCAQTEWNGMGNSDVDPMYYVRKMNDSLAASARPFDPGVLVPFNASVVEDPADTYTLTPQRHLPVPAAYGRPMAMPTVEQWYRLPCPIPFPAVPQPKIKITLKPGKGDEDYLDRMIEEGSISNLTSYAGEAATHPLTAVGAAPFGISTSVKVPGGQMRIGIGLKGFEVRESVCERLFEIYENADNMQAAMAELGIVGAPSGVQRTELSAGPLGQE